MARHKLPSYHFQPTPQRVKRSTDGGIITAILGTKWDTTVMNFTPPLWISQRDSPHVGINNDVSAAAHTNTLICFMNLEAVQEWTEPQQH